MSQIGVRSLLRKGKLVRKNFWKKNDQTGLQDRSLNEQKETWELIVEYARIFAMRYMDFGKTSLVKQRIRLMDNTSFKECYQCIPQSMYVKVWEHLKEMLEIVAVWLSRSPCASLVILVWMKDGKLQFCIDLRKLNVCSTKDSYSLPRIEDTLDSLNGAVWFSTLDLNFGYWQVEMDEAFKPLTAFTVGLLGFYKCDHIPLALVNSPATFQTHVWVTLSSLGVPTTSTTSLYFQNCQMII